MCPTYLKLYNIKLLSYVVEMTLEAQEDGAMPINPICLTSRAMPDNCNCGDNAFLNNDNLLEVWQFHL